MKAVILAGGLGSRLSKGNRSQAESDGRNQRSADSLTHHEDLFVFFASAQEHPC
jgi:hypothetical protein